MEAQFWAFAREIWPESMVNEAHAKPGITVTDLLHSQVSSHAQFDLFMLQAYWLAFKNKHDLPLMKAIFMHMVTTRAKVLPEYTLEPEQIGYTNLQLLRGSACNVKCVMCFTLGADEKTVEKSRKAEVLSRMKVIRYSKGALFFQALFARMAYGLKEFLLSSYGDPLANRVYGQDLYVAICEEIEIAKLAGYEQITILTNGTGLLRATEKDLKNHNKLEIVRYRLQRFVDSGLTNITFSLHTPDPEVWQQIINPHKNNPATHADLVQWVRMATTIDNLTVRINVAYGSFVAGLAELAHSQWNFPTWGFNG